MFGWPRTSPMRIIGNYLLNGAPNKSITARINISCLCLSRSPPALLSAKVVRVLTPSFFSSPVSRGNFIYLFRAMLCGVGVRCLSLFLECNRGDLLKLKCFSCLFIIGIFPTLPIVYPWRDSSAPKHRSQLDYCYRKLNS
jgi:hypothetical protein